MGDWVIGSRFNDPYGVGEANNFVIVVMKELHVFGKTFWRSVEPEVWMTGFWFARDTVIH